MSSGTFPNKNGRPFSEPSVFTISVCALQAAFYIGRMQNLMRLVAARFFKIGFIKLLNNRVFVRFAQRKTFVLIIRHLSAQCANIRVVADIAEHPLALAELMEDLGLSRHAKHFPSELSGGQQQRCAIGRALIKNPAILLCDEPTGALDSASAREVLAILEQINRKYHTTVIIITHNEAVAGMADRVIRIHDGKVKSNTENEKVRIEELDI